MHMGSAQSKSLLKVVLKTLSNEPGTAMTDA